MGSSIFFIAVFLLPLPWSWVTSRTDRWLVPTKRRWLACEKDLLPTPVLPGAPTDPTVSHKNQELATQICRFPHPLPPRYASAPKLSPWLVPSPLHQGLPPCPTPSHQGIHPWLMLSPLRQELSCGVEGVFSLSQRCFTVGPPVSVHPPPRWPYCIFTSFCLLDLSPRPTAFWLLSLQPMFNCSNS